MQSGRPSATAFRVALRRAAHQLIDIPRVLDDPIALQIIGQEQAARLRADLRSHDASPFDRALRAFLVARSRIAEDALARAVESGVSQYVILGAGLDTFAYRSPYPGLMVFEVDYPATQVWKRECLEAAGISPPPSVRFVPMDFERQILAEELERAGLARDRSAWFSWLGVTPYLDRDAVMQTFEVIALLAGDGGGVTFDYGLDPSVITPAQRVLLAALEERVKRAGEPFKSLFVPAQLTRALNALGFRAVDDLDADAINARCFTGRSDGLRVGSLGRLMIARV